MDTTQKTREDAAQRRSRQEPAQQSPQGAKRPRPVQQGATPPASAQQNNGAARTAEAQRQAAANPRPRQEQAEKRAAPQQRAGQAEKRPAPKQTREAPQKKRTAVKQDPRKKAAAAPRKKSTKIKADPEDTPNKKRAYGKSKPKKKSAVATMADAIKQNTEKNAAKKAKKKTNRPKQPTPAVIYTQPAAFNRNRLLTQLITVTAIVVALVLGLSIFFKVEHITVSGVNVYSEWAVREACGINEGDNLLTLSHARSAALIKANLPYVKSVRFGIKLPDTVNIMIDEEDVVYAIKDQNGTWWLMNSDGEIVEMGNNSKASDHTQVLGVTLENPVAGQKGIATEVVPTETDPATGELVPATVTGAQRLRAALQILKALEDNDIVGSAASVDVTRIEDIILWYGTRYQVNLGDSSRLDYKIACMNDVILQMSDYQSGILDISFNIWTDRVGYTPFA